MQVWQFSVQDFAFEPELLPLGRLSGKRPWSTSGILRPDLQARHRMQPVPDESSLASLGRGPTICQKRKTWDRHLIQEQRLHSY